MLNCPYFITPHAIRQFIDRIAPRMDFDQARDTIIEGLRNAGPEKPTASRAAFYVRVRGEWNFRAVLGRGEGALPAVVTILRSGK